MLEEKVNNEDIDFICALYNPTCLSECLFDNIDNLTSYDPDKYGHIRLYQLPMQSSEYMLLPNPKLTQKKNFRLLENAGEINNFGARKFGKSVVTLMLDVVNSILLLDGWETIFTSIDYAHIQKILEKVCGAIENHPVVKLFKGDGHGAVKRNPYIIKAKNGFELTSVNMNLSGKAPGKNFYGFHVRKLWGEEMSFETQEVNDIREESKAEIGCISRLSGMCNFTKTSPVGKIFYDPKKRKSIVNYPQYVSPMWDVNEEERALKKYGSRSAPSYRIFIGGEVVESGISCINMQLIRPFYREAPLTEYSIDRDSLLNFKNIIVVERPKKAENIYINADIGEDASTDINIVADYGDEKYEYIYAVTLYNLTDIEQKKIFHWLAVELSANIIGIDVTDGTGRAIANYLAEVFGQEHIVRVGFNTKIPVAIKKDEKTNKDIYEIKEGKAVPVFEMEHTSDWSVKRLQHLLYNGAHLTVPEDFALDTQLNAVQAVQGTTKVNYPCLSPEDHRWQSFQVFSIAEWTMRFKKITSVSQPRNEGVTGLV